MASCTLNTKSRQRVHRHNYYLSAVCPDRWHNWWYIVSWCDHLTFERVVSGQWWGDVTWWSCVGWCDVLKEHTRPRSPVLPIIAQFNWQLASCSELLNFRSNSAGLGPGSHWHSAICISGCHPLIYHPRPRMPGRAPANIKITPTQFVTHHSLTTVKEFVTIRNVWFKSWNFLEWLIYAVYIFSLPLLRAAQLRSV